MQWILTHFYRGLPTSILVLKVIYPSILWILVPLMQYLQICWIFFFNIGFLEELWTFEQGPSSFWVTLMLLHHVCMRVVPSAKQPMMKPLFKTYIISIDDIKIKCSVNISFIKLTVHWRIIKDHPSNIYSFFISFTIQSRLYLS